MRNHISRFERKYELLQIKFICFMFLLLLTGLKCFLVRNEADVSVLKHSVRPPHRTLSPGTTALPSLPTLAAPCSLLL